MIYRFVTYMHIFGPFTSTMFFLVLCLKINLFWIELKMIWICGPYEQWWSQFTIQPKCGVTVWHITVSIQYVILIISRVTCSKFSYPHQSCLGYQIINTWCMVSVTRRYFFLIMASSNRSIFRVTGPLWGESAGDRWSPLIKAREQSFNVFFELCLYKRLSK